MDSIPKSSQLLMNLPSELDEPKVDEPAIDDPAVEEEDGNALKLTLPPLDIPPLAPQDSGKLSKPCILNAVETGLGVARRAAANCRISNMRASVASYIGENSGVESSQLLFWNDTIQPDLTAEVDEPVIHEPAVDEPVIVEPAVDELAVEVVAVNAPRIAFRLAPPKTHLGPTLLEFQEEDDNALKLTLPLLDISLVEPTQVTGKLAKPHILSSVEIGLGVTRREAADCRISNMRTFVASFIPVYREEGFKDDLFSLKKRLVRLMWDGAIVLDALCSAEARATLSSGGLDEERSKILMDSVRYAAMFCVVTGGSLNDVLSLSMSDLKCFGSVQAS